MLSLCYGRNSGAARRIIRAIPSGTLWIQAAGHAALTPPQPGRHALRARPQQPGRHALRARPLAAALVETAGLVPDGARHVSEDLVKKTHRFDVSLTEPLGLTLGEAQAGKDTCVYVKTVDESGGAHFRLLVRVGFGGAMSPRRFQSVSVIIAELARRWQAEAMLNQRVLSRSLSRKLPVNLRNCDMAFVNHQQIIVGEKVQKAKGRFIESSAIEMHRIIFDSCAISDFLQHLKVIFSSHSKPLRL